MSYTPTTWTTGDTITASAMNKIEQGIANGGSGALICTIAYNDDLDAMAMDKTVQEIYNALIGGTPVYAKYQYGVLGTDYIGNVYLAPVVKIYNYNTTDVIRVCVQKPTSVGSKNSYEYLLAPSIAIFSATGLNQYPRFYITVDLPNAYCDASVALE